tara:strand:+ start:3147 stop:3776 length:630 start_codon:yes stop_codon:yes gene_type:complete
MFEVSISYKIYRDFNEYKQYIEILMITELENSFLYFCQSDEEENYFKNSLIYLCKNDSEGSFGIVINKRVNINLKDFSMQPDKDLEEILNRDRVFLGGPVSPFSPFILHSLDKKYTETLEVTSNIGVSSKPDVINAILRKEFPKKFIVSFGYTGWSAGQLEKEIQQGSWLIIPANEQIIFSTKSSKKIEEASKIAGFNINLVSNNYGKA